jgi:putative mRNA 3-end processing factor
MKIPFEVRPEGLYCQWGDFYVDASRPVNQCIVTHAHGDHARWGHKHYIATLDSVPILHHRLGANLSIQGLEYGQKLKIGQCWVSLHPAGHIFGSAQIRIESREGIYVISGDYKRAQDPTSLPYEGIPCDVFVTESTFALPIYHWEDPTEIARKIYHWWQNNSAEDHPSVLFCYALGKAQRILSTLRSFTEQPIYVHGAILPIASIYAEKKIPMLPFLPIGEKKEGKNFAKELILAPPSAAGTPWLKRFPTFRTASASGWMQVRGTRRRKGMDQGFVLSDHADWEGLLQTIEESQAKIVLTAHGSSDVLARYLRETKGLDARELKGLESSEEGEG